MKTLTFLFFAALSLSSANPRYEAPAFVSDSGLYALALVVPKEKKTKIYKIENDTFKLTHTFDWIAEEVYIQDTYQDVSVVKVTPYFEKKNEWMEHVCIEFFWNFESVAKVKVKDLLRKGDMLYSNDREQNFIITKTTGYHRHPDLASTFQVESGNLTLIFETSTGRLLTSQNQQTK
ncbi:MAG: hypothetical protein ACSHX4_04580 [Opitutaceae bacterium]